MLKSTYTTETIDRLFLELSQFTQATTAKELLFQAELSRSADELARLREGINAALAEIRSVAQALPQRAFFEVTAVGAYRDAADIIRKHTGFEK